MPKGSPVYMKNEEDAGLTPCQGLMNLRMLRDEAEFDRAVSKTGVNPISITRDDLPAYVDTQSIAARVDISADGARLKC